MKDNQLKYYVCVAIVANSEVIKQTLIEFSTKENREEFKVAMLNLGHGVCNVSVKKANEFLKTKK